jgi:hypothetical protein
MQGFIILGTAHASLSFSLAHAHQLTALCSSFPFSPLPCPPHPPILPLTSSPSRSPCLPLSTDYAHRYREAEAQLAKWVAEGKLKVKTHIYQPSNPSPRGIENLPRGLVALFNGENSGKMVVKVWDGKTDGQERSKL